MSDYIPADILVDILKKLPIETLMRYRCVCKLWKQIIDSHSFSLDHLALQNPQFMAQYEEDEFLILDLEKLPLFETQNRPVKSKHLYLVGTLHGIVCLYDDFLKLFFFWNPSTRKFSIRSVPESVGQFDWLYNGYSYGTCAGFWIDPKNYVMKVVAFTLDSFDDSEGDLYGMLYSSITDWKRVSLSEIQGYYTVQATPPVMVQGVAHWVAQYEFADGEDEPWFGVVVVSFDFVQETFDTIEAYSVPKDMECPVLCCSEGEISLLYMYPVPNKKCFIYTRKGDEWVHVFDIGLVPEVTRVLWGVVEVEEVELKEEANKEETNKEGTRKISKILATKGDELVLFETKVMRCRTLKTGIKDPAAFAMAYGYVESVLYVSS